MAPVIILLFLLLPFAQLEVGNDLYPSAWTKYKDWDNFEEIQINQNFSRGCICKKYQSKWSICFGNDSCQKFPEITVNSINFKIRSTMIQILNKNDFKNITQLRNLAIESNTFLTVIEPGIFSNMSILTNLSISFNPSLKVLQKTTFTGLDNLKELFLVKNGFETIKDVIPSLATKLLPNIFKISLSENIFSEIGKNDFEPMRNSTLRELNLVSCQIEYIHSESLSPLRNVAAIRLGNNFLNSSTLTELITNSTKHELPLQFINLNGLGFRKIPPRFLMKAISQSSITQLCLSRNQFEIITNNTFPAMPSIKYLDLREVLASDIKAGAFQSLPNLRTLILSGNKLSFVPSGVMLEELTYLDLSANSINSSSSEYFVPEINKFITMKKLKYLNLSFNRIHSIYNFTFNGLSRLRVLGLKNANIERIDDHALSSLSSLLVLNLENNNFPLTRNVFSGLGNLQVLLLGGCSISSISTEENPFHGLSLLAHLSLENNYLITLSHDLVKPLPNLVNFDVSKNYISSWNDTIFAYNIKLSVVLASYNKFSHLTFSMLNDFANLSRLDISKNPFICDCLHFEPFSTWIKQNENSSLIGLITVYPTFCAYPYEFSNDTIITAFNAMQTGTPCEIISYKLYFFFILPSAVFLVTIIVSCILTYFLRWHIRYWLFLARAYMVSLGIIAKRRDLKSYTNYKYDAFVSYSNEDKNFAVRLVAMLENFDPFLRLCVAERDFEVGSVISDLVLANLEESRNTVLIISDSYARSEWHRWEVHIVRHHQLHFEGLNKNVDDSLIMIKLGNVNITSCTPTLKYLLKTRIYLEWDSNESRQMSFWNKLRETLSPRRNLYDSYF